MWRVQQIRELGHYAPGFEGHSSVRGCTSLTLNARQSSAARARQVLRLFCRKGMRAGRRRQLNPLAPDGTKPRKTKNSLGQFNPKKSISFISRMSMTIFYPEKLTWNVFLSVTKGHGSEELRFESQLTSWLGPPHEKDSWNKPLASSLNQQ